ncbi:MAG: GIY-YIG nuclease family protein [Firmicutes bacterium]|nr:GIY-YIG nuclease family protein [Bacillota bacterium]
MSDESVKKEGYVYVLKNELFPGLLKIGKTSQLPEDRAKNFDTGLPKPWTVICAVKLKNYEELEKTLHSLFTFRRLNSSREFFYFSYEESPKKKKGKKGKENKEQELEDIVKLFRFFSESKEYAIRDATDQIAGDVRDFEESDKEKKIAQDKIKNGAKFRLKGQKEATITYVKEKDGFLFGNDIASIKRPNLSKSASQAPDKLYDLLISEGKIGEDGILKIAGEIIPIAFMSRYTGMIIAQSKNWKEYWVDENRRTIKSYLG